MSEKTITCPSCGATNPVGYTFCFHCRAEPSTTTTTTTTTTKGVKKKATKRKR